jgi:hypothetical protein
VVTNKVSIPFMVRRIAARKGVTVWRGEAISGVPRAEGPVGVEEAGRVLQMHVVAGCAGLAVTTLEEQDLFRNSGGDGRSEATLPGGDAREAAGIRAAGPENAAQGVAEHLVGDWDVGWGREAARFRRKCHGESEVPAKVLRR